MGSRKGSTALKNASKRRTAKAKSDAKSSESIAVDTVRLTIYFAKISLMGRQGGVKQIDAPTVG
ncbi:MAG: hypothetical protein IT424_15615 [Pirellulales bacterium]|nr:hypothetical protein [Pirellulales bacterium]